MEKLTDLLHSLTEVIIRYHDAHVSEPLVRASAATIANAYREKSEELISSPETLEETFSALITKCTTAYPERRHLLQYLAHQIGFLNSFISKATSSSVEELNRYKAQLSTMLIDFKQLLDTKKSNVHRVSYSTVESGATPKEIGLNGLVKDGYFEVGHFCDSGTLLDEIVMQRLQLTTKSTDESIKDTIDVLCNHHQKPLVDAEKSVLEKRELALNKEKAVLTVKLEQAEPKLLDLERENEALKSTLAEERSKRIELEESARPEELRAAKEKISEQDKTINELRAQLTQKNFPLFKGQAKTGFYSPLLFAALATAQQKAPGQVPAPKEGGSYDPSI